jgi:hypothetical protein
MSNKVIQRKGHVLSKTLLFLSFCFSGYLVKAQKAQELQPDQGYYSALQFVYPDFFFSEDGVVMDRFLSKYYSEASYMAYLADSLGVSEQQAVKQELDLVLQLTRNKFLAEKMKSITISMDTVVTDKQLKTFYEENIHQFSENGSISYVIAYAQDTTNQTIEDIKQAFLGYSKSNLEETTFSKADEGSYMLTAEFNVPFGKGTPFYSELADSKENNIYGPIVSNDRFVFILPKQIKPVVTLGLDEAAAQVKASILEQRRLQYLQDLGRRSKTMYPFRLERAPENGQEETELYNLKFDN